MSILYAHEDGIASITLERPGKHNALTLAMLRQLEQAFLRARDDAQVRVVLLQGAGEQAFCAGADLADAIPALAEGRMGIEAWDGAFLKTPGFHKPVIAAVQGLCLGGGFELMLAADLRIAAEDARFGLPEPAMGFVPAAGTLARLVRQVPRACAMELLLAGRQAGAQRLLQMGLLNAVVPRAALMQEAWALARQVATLDPQAVRVILQAAATLPDLPLQQAFAEEARLARPTFTSPQARAALARFAQR